MAGIYLHIPFCKSKCPYCNFYSVASTKQSGVFFEALLKEISLSRDYLGGRKVATVYFGGGTPSLLPAGGIEKILESLHSIFPIENNAEITLEANPDDISAERLMHWAKAGINRLSIGIQSFADVDLRYLGRVHSGEQALRSLNLALDKGFSNLSADFIYGMPTLTDAVFAGNLEKAVNLGVPHISAYALTVEPKTAMDVMIRKNRMQGPSEEKAASQFAFLMKYLENKGYEHYEISNFCLPGMYSRHNSSYWKGEHYLGLGPSAHSFNGDSRQWNVPSIGRYSELLMSGQPHFETEILDTVLKYNEYVMVSLRTMWGINEGRILADFGESFADHFRNEVSRHLQNGNITENKGNYCLSQKGKLFADGISADLFADID